MEPQKKNYVPAIITIVVLLLVGGLIYAGSKNPANQEGAVSTNQPATNQKPGTTVKPGTKPATAPTAVQPATSQTTTLSGVAYKLTTERPSYTPEETINFTLTLTNTTNAPKTFNFKSGCQTSYKIARYDMSEGLVCTSALTSFTIAARGTREIKMAHNPLHYVVPVGKQTITARVIGYGSASAPVTISQTAVAAKPTLTVVSPNGGETWKWGNENYNLQPYEVRWSIKRAEASQSVTYYTVHMYLVDESGAEKFFWAHNGQPGVNSASVLSAGMNRDIMPGRYKMKMRFSDGHACPESSLATCQPKPDSTFDLSDNYFTISN